ncbi:MAG: AmmeMemoRadiSam system radical SAM enzyme [Planctomycetota bacterium]
MSANVDDPGIKAASRRSFLRACIASGCTLPFAASLSDALAAPKVQYGGIFYEKKARNWEPGENKAVTCGLCPRHCTVPDGGRGYCGVRENRNGTYYTLVWGNACAVGVDPIEKKPLAHVIPGEKAFSIATAGCNLKCKFCQNWNISQSRPERTRNIDLPPDEVVKSALRYNCKAVAFTYNEPTVFHEYMVDTAAAAKTEGLKPVVISNGFIDEDPMIEMCKVMTAIKIDLKAFTKEFYKTMTGGRLKPVLETLQLLKKQGMWFEIVNLIIPTLNDKPDDIKAMCKWIKKELGPGVPLHFSAFHPMYKLRNLPRTPNKTMFAAYDIARAEGLQYVYVGNVRPAGHRAEQTYCPKCGKVVIDRRAYLVRQTNLKDGKCAFCGREIPGVWK